MDVTILNVAEIRAEANSGILPNGRPHYWQALVLLDAQGNDLGRITLHLDSPEVALPVGDQPPYWGIDLTKPLAAQLEGPAF
jgi:hypothetical protein